MHAVYIETTQKCINNQNQSDFLKWTYNIIVDVNPTNHSKTL